VGVVKEFRLVNPHMSMTVEVTKDNGEKDLWTVVTVSGPPARNPDFKGRYVRKLDEISDDRCSH
jgi:hypothetical protein